MDESSSSQATPASPQQRWPLGVAAAGAVGAGLGLILTAAYVVRRPPCPPNYVRLIDPGLFLVVLLGALLVAELAVVLVARGRGRHPVAGVIGAVLGIGVLLLLVAAVALLGQTVGSASVDSGCWTF